MRTFNDWLDDYRWMDTLHASSAKLGWGACEAEAKKEINELEERLNEAISCLEFYAEKENWAQTIDGKYNTGKIWIDLKQYGAIALECGERARECLKKIN